jgi:hypothetical protein
MTIKETDVFKVKMIHGYPEGTPTVDIFFSPLEKLITLRGAELKAQYSTAENFIVFLIDARHHEESLYIYLLDNAANILDSVELSAWYTYAFLENLKIMPPNHLHFSFFDDSESWIIEVLPKPKIQLWANDSLVKRNHPFLHKTYFKLERTK